MPAFAKLNFANWQGQHSLFNGDFVNLTYLRINCLCTVLAFFLNLGHCEIHNFNEGQFFCQCIKMIKILSKIYCVDSFHLF